ncbi:MAG: OmpH family outer membrane protein [Bacteroidia bacterium]|nr:OmpH family outer membrane protein [Bacteroidia bacterium]
MKNSSTIIHIALGLAILVLYILHFSSRGGQPTGENSSPSDTIRNASGKSRPIRRSSTASPADSLRLRIAYVNSDTLLARYSYYQQKKKELEARQQQN